MSESYPQQTDNEFNWFTCGSIKVVYNDELLEAATEALVQDNQESGYTRHVLAESRFIGTTNQHITNASFGIERRDDTHSASTGTITFALNRTSPNRISPTVHSVLRDLWEHLRSQPAFLSYNLVLTDNDKLTATNDLYTFDISLKIHPLSAQIVTLSVEAIHDTPQPLAEDTMATCGAWAQVCDYVITLGVAKGAAVPLEATATIAVGELVEPPSEIEHALVLELDARRKNLGATATLPSFDNSIILSLDIERLAMRCGLTPIEITKTAETVVTNKMHEFGQFGAMTSISHTCITDAIKRVVNNRAG